MNKKCIQYLDNKGSFKLEQPNKSSYMYFPVANESGLMGALTPLLNGDIKTGINNFALAPVSAEDLHNTKSARNFFVYNQRFGAWSCTGNSPVQEANCFNEVEKVTLEAGFLWHKVTRINEALKLKAEVLTYVPANEDKIELTKVTITNLDTEAINITPTAAIPIYGRSADNLRDHRHVTSLLNRIKTSMYGIRMQPVLSFDERGHEPNQYEYSVFASDGDGIAPNGFFPIVEDYIGEGGSLYWPEAVVKNLPPTVKTGELLEGYETVGAIRFDETLLSAGESKTYIMAVVVDETGENSEDTFFKYKNENAFDKNLLETSKYWDKKLNLNFTTGDKDYDNWMRWTSFQPILRRIYGCSFMPHHDYGRGGRGWRDLWQDCLALILMEPDEVRYLLFNNYAGVRFDGTNATIIGNKPGEFIADRNNITRVWMDHGAWPFLTTKLYIDQSGDIDFLLEKQAYFKDQQVHRGKKKDLNYDISQGSLLRQENGSKYEGTILEHILIQNLTAFFNVGDHNIAKLDGADWNDALDMAPDRGESVAFMAFYSSNLRQIGQMLEVLQSKGIGEVQIAKELMLLIGGKNQASIYESVEGKHQVLEAYYESCEQAITGEVVNVSINELVEDLNLKADWMKAHISGQEWIESQEGYQWFNGYYDNHGQRVEGDHPNGVRMTLTGQVFNIMGNIADDEQIAHIINAADKYLYSKEIGGYRLNTNFHEFKHDLGRAFGFAYGHKENGAMFSHMAVMYGNALYQRGYFEAGNKVIQSIYDHCSDFEKSRIYPGIPEYISEKGRGMYHYLTGSASWLILTVLTQVFGVRGDIGDLMIAPQLLPYQFDEANTAGVVSKFADRSLNIIIHNDKLLMPDAYCVKHVTINQEEVPFEDNKIQRDKILALSKEGLHTVEVFLDERAN